MGMGDFVAAATTAGRTREQRSESTVQYQYHFRIASWSELKGGCSRWDPRILSDSESGQAGMLRFHS